MFKTRVLFARISSNNQAQESLDEQLKLAGVKVTLAEIGQILTDKGIGQADAITISSFVRISW